ncbi:MAG: hypothetical protein A2235_04980 [Deltaproteobacteria bacterium RIFOXYA2_FULL_42_10]|nr:MAG: hypothetical protein A2090_03105 [Deltaproteobacteria bacterium GWD2_42_10]OGQ74829.1 MAG: hypothetical protein A2235_04980 [Deltaproteobacteria bacterium RIFOXYA2_FULL_42_10]
MSVGGFGTAAKDISLPPNINIASTASIDNLQKLCPLSISRHPYVIFTVFTISIADTFCVWLVQFVGWVEQHETQQSIAKY